MLLGDDLPVSLADWPALREVELTRTWHQFDFHTAQSVDEQSHALFATL